MFLQAHVVWVSLTFVLLLLNSMLLALLRVWEKIGCAMASWGGGCILLLNTMIRSSPPYSRKRRISRWFLCCLQLVIGSDYSCIAEKTFLEEGICGAFITMLLSCRSLSLLPSLPPASLKPAQFDSWHFILYYYLYVSCRMCVKNSLVAAQIWNRGRLSPDLL